MKETRLLMGMPITIEIVDKQVMQKNFDKIFSYFGRIDKAFSPFKPDSDVSKINRGEILVENYSTEMKEVFSLAEKTKKETNGYFNIVDNNGKINPSGIVKGWAVYCAAQVLLQDNFENFYINAGGDIQFYGKNANGEVWSAGIKNPFNQKEIVKIVYMKSGRGIATSGNYIRGDHIYNPKNREEVISDIVSFTVIASNVLEADRFATAVFAMGKGGIEFLEKMPQFAGYMIDKSGIAYMTSNFEKYTYAKKS